jgi:hypothetical protein
MHPLVRFQYRGWPKRIEQRFSSKKVIDLKGRTSDIR